MSLVKFADINIINFNIKLDDCSSQYSSLNTLEMEYSVFSKAIIDLLSAGYNQHEITQKLGVS